MQAEYQLKQRIMEEFAILRLTKAILEIHEAEKRFFRREMMELFGAKWEAECLNS